MEGNQAEQNCSRSKNKEQKNLPQSHATALLPGNIHCIIIAQPHFTALHEAPCLALAWIRAEQSTPPPDGTADSELSSLVEWSILYQESHVWLLDVLKVQRWPLVSPSSSTSRLRRKKSSNFGRASMRSRTAWSNRRENPGMHLVFTFSLDMPGILVQHCVGALCV